MSYLIEILRTVYPPQLYLVKVMDKNYEVGDTVLYTAIFKI